MILHASRVALLAGALAVATSSVAGAQQAAPDAAAPRCGGLLCDMGIFGGPADRTTLPCDDFFCRAFGGGRTAQVAAPPEPVAAPAQEPVKAKKTRRARVARASMKRTAQSEAKEKAAPAEAKVDPAAK